MTRYYYIC